MKQCFIEALCPHSVTFCHSGVHSLFRECLICKKARIFLSIWTLQKDYAVIKVSGSNPDATTVFFRGLNDAHVCHVTWNNKMTTSDRKTNVFDIKSHRKHKSRQKLTESWNASSLTWPTPRRPWSFPDGQTVLGRYPDAACYQGESITVSK